MSYSNIGLSIVAYVIEKLSGVSYEGYIQQHIFAPLNIESASFRRTPFVSLHLAAGYLVANNNKSRVDYHHLKDRAAGALNISAQDLSKIQRMLLGFSKNNSTNILTENSIQSMSHIETTLAATVGYQLGYGKYLISEQSKNTLWLGHSGEMISYLAEMYHSPQHQIGFVVMTNTGGDSAKQGMQKIKEQLKIFTL